MEDLDEAIRLDPQFAAAYANRAVVYTFLGKDAEAEQDTNKAVELGFDRDKLDGQVERAKRMR
jgi:Tfp pilus assembly protein PilF